MQQSAIAVWPGEVEAPVRSVDRTTQNLRYLTWLVILVITTLVAFPRFGMARPVNHAAAVGSHLHVLRTAISQYWAHHGTFPGQSGAAMLRRQLLEPSSPEGLVGPGQWMTYGPYIRSGEIPDNPLAMNNSIRVVETMPASPMGREAWIYCSRTGDLRANVTGTDSNGTRLFSL